MMRLLIVTGFLVFFAINDGLNAQTVASPEAIQLNEGRQAILKRYDSLEKVRSNYVDSLRMPMSSITNARLHDELKAVNKYIYQNRGRDIETFDFEFIRNHPNSNISLSVLEAKIKNGQCNNGYDTFSHYFSILSSSLKNSNYGIAVEKRLMEMKNSSVGSVAPDFKVKTIDRNTISLTEFKNRNAVLIDFWGSRCGPCRQGMHFLKSVYRNYQPNGFEIIGIAANYDDVDAIKRAIRQDGTDIWIQVAAKTNDDDVFKKYLVQSMPVRILINKSGVIVGRWYGNTEENDADLTAKLKEIFN